MHWTLDGASQLSGFLLELILVIATFRLRLQREFPLFSSYVVLLLVRTTTLFAFPLHHPPYFYAYWISEGVVAIFGFFVVKEIFWKAFESRLGLRKLGDALFRYSLMALVIASVIVAAMAPGTDADKLSAAILVLKQTQSFVRIGLVVSLFFFVTLLGLSWRDYVIGVAAGFAIHGIAELAALIVGMHYGPSANGFYVWSTVSAGFFQLLFWIGYLMCVPFFRSRAFTRSKDQFSVVSAEVSKISEVVDSFLER